MVDDLVGSDVERALDALVPRWIAAGLAADHAPGTSGATISWPDWIALADLQRDQPRHLDGA